MEYYFIVYEVVLCLKKYDNATKSNDMNSGNKYYTLSNHGDGMFVLGFGSHGLLTCATTAKWRYVQLLNKTLSTSMVEETTTV